ncbi:hypothetical protein PVK06_044705 [Gossypium arboreum]|uniref:Uncharacterized protein n=1 Tax=Gossypium arboreum TaxID=29729 RepID=A0ABR0MRX4_GOSAR|nr:hypothetical protein PVK06_044705 [Gossypium arboreum]
MIGEGRGTKAEAETLLKDATLGEVLTSGCTRKLVDSKRSEAGWEGVRPDT